MKADGKLKLTNCDNGQYTRDWFKAQVVGAKLSYMDLAMYAGYHRRSNIVKECMIVDTEVVCVSCVCVFVCVCMFSYTYTHTYTQVPTK
jgi:uncharacterized membrane protein YesL